MKCCTDAQVPVEKGRAGLASPVSKRHTLMMRARAVSVTRSAQTFRAGTSKMRVSSVTVPTMTAVFLSYRCPHHTYQWTARTKSRPRRPLGRAPHAGVSTHNRDGVAVPCPAAGTQVSVQPHAKPHSQNGTWPSMNWMSLEREIGGLLILDMYILFSTTLLKGASVRRARKRYSCMVDAR